MVFLRGMTFFEALKTVLRCAFTAETGEVVIYVPFLVERVFIERVDTMLLYIYEVMYLSSFFNFMALMKFLFYLLFKYM